PVGLPRRFDAFRCRSMRAAPQLPPELPPASFTRSTRAAPPAAYVAPRLPWGRRPTPPSKFYMKTLLCARQKFGSSRKSGEGSADLEEEVGIIAEAVGHPLEDLDLVVDPLEQAGVQRPAAVGKDTREQALERARSVGAVGAGWRWRGGTSARRS